MTAYRNHDFDPILMCGGDKLVFRAFEVTGGCGDINHCPDKFCFAAAQKDIMLSQGIILFYEKMAKFSQLEYLMLILVIRK